MPSKTDRQARTMGRAAHDPEFAKRMGIPQSVAKDFNEADAKSGRLSRAMKNRSKRKRKGPDGGGRAAKQHRQNHG